MLTRYTHVSSSQSLEHPEHPLCFPMQEKFSKDLASALAIMLLELSAELDEFQYQLDVEQQVHRSSPVPLVDGVQ